MLPADATSQRDDLLAELLDGLTRQLRAGDVPDLEGAIRKNPDLADDLRELWAAVALAEAMANQAQQLEVEEQRGRSASAASQLLSPASGDGDKHGTAPTLPAESRRGKPVVCPGRFGDYELLEELGRGGMGVVYKARQISLGRIVAIKLLLRGTRASPLDQARFRVEAEAVARLTHPNIVSVYEVGEIDDQLYFSMQFVAGVTLARRLAEGLLPPREAAQLLAKAARAVHYAHEQGVLHRDLKPSNILLDGDGRPHIGDFGLAKRVESDSGLTHTGDILGTPNYMSPEQAGSGRTPLGRGSDVYSLGTMLYEMLTGRPPFQAASPVDTLLRVREEDPLPPRLLNPKADSDLEMIALRCLQKPPDLRYATAADLAADLEAFLAGEPISARSGKFHQVAARWFRETHHATVLENWGLLWMWHSLVLLVLCVLTHFIQAGGVTSPGPYFLLWTVGLGAWAAIFWALRRRAGPVTFVERQIAHIWAGSMISIGLLYVVEILLGLPVLMLAPVLGLVNGATFVAKAGILSGAFYVQAAALFVTALVMCYFPNQATLIFGVVGAACFFFPGLKYYRQKARGERPE